MRTLTPILLIGLVTGCGVLPQYPRQTHTLSEVAVHELPGGDGVAIEASAARWKADASRLAQDIERAVKRSDWGLLELSSLPVKTPAPSLKPITAQALLPDSRVAYIHGWALSEGEVAAAVMIGRFGDRREQEHFLQILADTLADKPKPRRGGTFELP